MNDTIIQKVPVSVTIMSIVTALFIDSKLINDILVAYGLPEGIMAYIYIGIVALVINCCALWSKTTRPSKNLKVFVLAIFLLSFFAITQSLVGEPRVSFLLFGVFTIAALIIPSLISVDVRTLIKTILIIPLLGLPVIDKIFLFVADWNEWISLGTSYNVIPPILAAVTYLLLYYKTDNKWQKLFTVIVILGNSVYMVKLLLFGSRGPVLAILGLVFFLIITTYDNNHIRINKSRISTVIVLGICSFLLIMFSPQIIGMAVEKSGLGSTHAIEKFISLSQEDDVSNGRTPLFNMAVKGILDSPLWGNGLDQFDNNHPGEDYPHNSILQILYDGGLLLFFVVIIPLLSRYITKLKRCTYDEYGFMFFIFFAGIWGSFFTGDLWEIPLLWLAIGSMFSKTFIYSRNW